MARGRSENAKGNDDALRVLLMGNPNVGKSAVFSRLTGAHVIASNYPGTTVSFTEGKMNVDGRRCRVIDVPGTYSLEPSSRAEQVAVEMLGNGDVVVNVVDSTNLERNLNLTLQLLKRGVPTVVALNMWDEAVEHGVHIDVDALSGLLVTCDLINYSHWKDVLYEDGEPEYCAVGDGVIDWQPVVDHLIASGFDGYWAIEYEAIEDIERGTRDSLACLQGLL